MSRDGTGALLNIGTCPNARWLRSLKQAMILDSNAVGPFSFYKPWLSGMHKGCAQSRSDSAARLAPLFTSALRCPAPLGAL